MMDNMTPREAQADVPSTDPPHELLAAIADLQARLTKLEARDTRGLLGKQLGKNTAVALLLAVFLISGMGYGLTPAPRCRTPCTPVQDTPALGCIQTI